ncbi:class F sortase [Planomonospora sp. ID91781]|uniref:Peptidase C60 n=1 Tax=Planomonospora sphaerica TaxID=161355 RepID=A0A161MA08_9ACTN|nr:MULTISPECIES: class F sortase [Planomonospora]MBG0820625.1 class F sortase [Planomonospora sp. ID91781]GAT66363.1 peptidase C60 [Planomonospora sphaerica]
MNAGMYPEPPQEGSGPLPNDGSGYPGDSSAHPRGAPAPGGGRKWLLPALLVAGSLAGVGVVMAGLLTYLAPLSEEEMYGPPVPQAAAQNQPPPVQPQDQGAAGAPAEVGPGGLEVPLTAAAPTAAPPLPVVMPPEPLRSEGVTPRRIAIPKIGVLSSLMTLGVDKKQRVQTPPLNRLHLAGWYRHGPVPGQQGPSVVLGHVNGNGKAGVFVRLKELRRGDKIKVSRSDGAVAEFTVDGVEQVSKQAFPSKRVYGNTGEATLRLITCGGVLNQRTGHYTDNIIVYATLSATGKASSR